MVSWTTPKTWADDDVPDKDDLNAQLRDNSEVLSTHTHNGSAGQGSDELEGIDKITFDDVAGSPSAAGELQRNGVNLEWYGAAVVAITEADAVAGTASPRTLGTGAQQAAAGDHNHVPTNVGVTTATGVQGAVGVSIGQTIAAETTVTGTVNKTPAQVRNSFLIAFGAVGDNSDGGGAHDLKLIIHKDAGEVATRTKTVGAGSKDGEIITYLDESPTVASHAYLGKCHQSDDSGVDLRVGTTRIDVREIAVP